MPGEHSVISGGLGIRQIFHKCISPMWENTLTVFATFGKKGLSLDSGENCARGRGGSRALRFWEVEQKCPGAVFVHCIGGSNASISVAFFVSALELATRRETGRASKSPPGAKSRVSGPNSSRSQGPIPS